ncbi:MAG TPA: GTPase HflX [Ktedonobacterales bacterium]|jgi:GTP-binding protein HflX|nr:GTPase HflX [Ktedonobacterales bacterium]
MAPKEGRFPTPRTDSVIDLKAENRAERAYLIAVDVDQDDALWDVEDSLAELAALASTAGAEVVGVLSQRLPAPTPNLYLGKGRANELAQICQEREIDLVIADDEISPSQQRNLEELTGARVIDRTALILDIFAQHARTREGQLQVELAQLEYRLPRLSGHGKALSRVGGGSRGATGGAGGAIGVRGPGETKLEQDRRRIRARISELRHDLETVRQSRSTQRRQRARLGTPVVAVVGYTNAGKSTLFNALTAANALAENKLFATLDPTTRRITLPTHQEILLTDTVGFIQKLPTTLVAAFRATLEEVVEADALLEVVDVTHENAIEQSQTVSDVLGELGAAEKPRVTALNKIDLLPDASQVDATLYPNAEPVSATQRLNLDALLRRVGEVLAGRMVRMQVLIPFDKGDLVELFHRRGQVYRQSEIEEGTLLTGAVPRALAPVFGPLRVNPERGRRRAFARPAIDPDTLAASSESARDASDAEPV